MAARFGAGPRNPLINPEQYSATSTFDLLREAVRGHAPEDHRLLRDLLARGNAILPDLLRMLQDGSEDARVDIDDLLLDLARQLKTPEALPFLAEYVRQLGFDFSDEATEAFIELGPAAAETLIALCAESNNAPDVVFTLAALGPGDDRVLTILTEVLAKDPLEGALALGLYGDPAAKPALERAHEAQTDGRIAHEIEVALEDIGRDQPERHLEPFDIFAFYPEEDTPLFAALDEGELVEYFESPSAAYRAKAIRMLMYDVPSPAIIDRVFGIAKTDSDPGVRGTAWESLGGLEDSPEILEALKRVLADESAPAVERAGALVALAESEGGDDALERIPEFYERPETRASAINAMWRSADRRFEAYIPKSFDDPDLVVRRQAVTAAGMFGIVSLLGRIENLFDDEHLRDAALYSYAMAVPSRVSPAQMRSLFRKIERLAGDLSDEEGLLVARALDDRLELNGFAPIFVDEEMEMEHEDEGDHEHTHAHDHAHEHQHAHDQPLDIHPTEPVSAPKPGRNDPCPCGSGKKYKKCCGQ